VAYSLAQTCATVPRTTPLTCVAVDHFPLPALAIW